MVRGTLVSEGPSDRRLIPILTWIISQHIDEAISIDRAHFVGRRPVGLNGRIELGIELFPCDILFIHRDGNGAGYAARHAEIEAAVNPASVLVPWVPVVPVRMQEAWLLFNEAAIRRAAGYPGGRDDLALPPFARQDSSANPKEVLREALKSASGLAGRKLRSFDVNAATDRLAEQIDDYSPLRRFEAFRQLEAEVEAALRAANLL